MRHPDEEQLLRYMDGELPSSTASRTRLHLEACWQCRVELEDVQKTVAECVRYRKDAQQYLPAPPAAWMDIYRGFEEIDRAESGGAWKRFTGFFGRSWTLGGSWARAAVAVVVLCTLFYWLRQTPSVQASELLRKAVIAAQGRPAGKARQLHIKTRRHSFTRPIGSKRASALSATDAAEMDSIAAMFLKANYNWDDPLSAKSFQAWRDQLPQKRDEVVELQDAYRIQTNTDGGELLEASLTLRMPDLQPLVERFEFRNQETVEITESAEEVAAPVETPVRTATRPGRLATPAAVPGETPTAVPTLPATAGDELHVLATLHQMGADLGEPVEVSLAGPDVLVSGVGVTPERQQAITSALGGQPRVVVRFSDSAPARVDADKATADTSTAADVSQLQSRMASQVGGRAYLEQLSAQVLDLNESMMAHAYALRRLAHGFPTDTEAGLSAADRQLLANLRQEHAAALLQQASEIDRALRPVLAPGNKGARAAPSAAGSSGTWQAATEDTFQSARRVEKLLAALFGASPTDVPSDQLPSQLLSSLAQLRAKLEAYHFTPQEIERRQK
jgi:hypothetical protein